MARKELEKFLKAYEERSNTHDFKNVKPLIAPHALYWFSDGTHEGINAIEKAFTKTWNKIQDETYRIKNVRWLIASSNVGVCVYDFHWSGKVNGKKQSGRGRGTNIIVKRGKKWQMIHEHLSSITEKS